MLLLGSRASHMIMLVCTLALLMETVRGGSSFLSPSPRPPGQGDRRHPKVVPRDTAQSDTLQEDAHFLVSPVFRLGLSLTEAEFEEHGSALQSILNTILGDTTD